MPKHSTLRLTKRIVERLKAEGKDAIYWDRDVAGFGVRVHTTGRKLYIVQSRGPAGLKRVTLGRVGDKPVDKHRREAAVVIDRIKRGEDPLPAPEPTVADLAERFLKTHVGARCKSNTAKSYRLAIRNHILPALGEKALREVGPEDVCWGPGHKVSTVRGDVSGRRQADKRGVAGVDGSSAIESSAPPRFPPSPGGLVMQSLVLPGSLQLVPATLPVAGTRRSGTAGLGPRIAASRHVG